MELQWSHTSLLDTPPPTKPRDALEQLTCNGLEDKCKMGNMAEMKAFLHSIPIRINIEYMTIRKVLVEMTDLFAAVKVRGVTADAEEKEGEFSESSGFHDDSTRGVARVAYINFAPFQEVSLYGFLWTFSTEVAKCVLKDHKAIYTGASEILGGLADNVFTKAGHVLQKAELLVPPNLNLFRRKAGGVSPRIHRISASKTAPTAEEGKGRVMTEPSSSVACTTPGSTFQGTPPSKKPPSRRYITRLRKASGAGTTTAGEV